MNRFFAVALTSAVLALPMTAQQGGSANRTTPTVGQSIAFTNGCSVKIEYRAIAWAQGRFMEALKTPEGRDRHNKGLKANPTGSLTASHDLSLAGQAVKAGTYKLYFEVDADTMPTRSSTSCSRIPLVPRPSGSSTSPRRVRWPRVSRSR